MLFDLYYTAVNGLTEKDKKESKNESIETNKSTNCLFFAGLSGVHHSMGGSKSPMQMHETVFIRLS